MLAYISNIYKVYKNKLNRSTVSLGYGCGIVIHGTSCIMDAVLLNLPKAEAKVYVCLRCTFTPTVRQTCIYV